MAIGKPLESILYLTSSLLLNLIIFTLLSIYLLIKPYLVEPVQPLRVTLEEPPIHPKHMELRMQKEKTGVKPKGGEGTTTRKGKDLVSASPYAVESKEGDVALPSGKPQEEPSLLEDIEKRVRGRLKEVDREGSPSREIGEVTAVISSGGVGLSGSSRGAVYIPPFPKLYSDEPLSPMKIKVWVEPSGTVSKAQIVQRSGSPHVDQKMIEFIKQIRFEAIKESGVQTGIITFRFKGG